MLFTSNATAEVIYVDDSGRADYTTIQDAITNAKDDDTIFVYNGTYNENVIINKVLTLISEDKTNTIIDGGGGDNVIYVTVDNINITGFTVQNSKDNGIFIYYGDFITISNNILLNNGIGIYLEESNNITIVNNLCTLNGNDGIRLESSNYNTIKDNICSNNKRGIRLFFSN